MSKYFCSLNAIFGAMAALTVASSANAQVCSNQSLKGSFGYTVTGTITKTTGPLIAGPFAAVGKLTFDGVGGVKTVRSFNDNGFALRGDPGTGTYTMNKDCTGSFTITVGPATSEIILSLDIVLDDTNQLRGVVTTADVVLSLEGRKQLPIIYF
jgi:hypothetical protein